MEDNLSIHSKTAYVFTLLPRIASLRIHPEHKSLIIQNYTYTRLFSAASLLFAKHWKIPVCPNIKDWFNKP